MLTAGIKPGYSGEGCNSSSKCTTTNALMSLLLYTVFNVLLDFNIAMRLQSTAVKYNTGLVINHNKIAVLNLICNTTNNHGSSTISIALSHYFCLFKSFQLKRKISNEWLAGIRTAQQSLTQPPMHSKLTMTATRSNARFNPRFNTALRQ